MYRCGLIITDTSGLENGSAKVTVTYSRIEGNGAATSTRSLNVDDGRIFFDSSRIQYNVGSASTDGGAKRARLAQRRRDQGRIQHALSAWDR